MTAQPTSRVRPRFLLAILGLGVSLVFGYLAVRDVRWGQMWEALKTSNYWWLVPSLAALALTFFVKAVRWQMLFVQPTRPRLFPVTTSLLVGHFFNNVLPARAGEAARVVALRVQTKTSAVEAAGTVVAERILDVCVLLALLLVMSPFLPSDPAWIQAASLLAAAALVAVLALVVVLARFGSRPFRAVARVLARIPGVPREPLEHGAEGLVRGLAVFREPRIAAVALPLTVLSWLGLALTFWFVMIGFDLGVGFGAGLLAAIVADLVLVLPSSPAGVGVFEAATIAALNVYGIDDSTALSYAIVIHTATLLPFVIVGYAALHWHVVTLRRAPVPAMASREPTPTPPGG